MAEKPSVTDNAISQVAPLNVSGAAKTKRKRTPGPRKDLVVLAELRLFNPDGTEFAAPVGMKAQAVNVSKDLTKWAIEQAEGTPSNALKVVVRVPQTSINPPNGVAE